MALPTPATKANCDSSADDPKLALLVDLAGVVDKFNLLLTALPASDASASVGFKQSGTSATARTVQDKLRESVSVKDFGAAGDGVTNDSAAIQAAIDYLATLGGGTLHVPSGNYLLTTALSPCSYLTVQGDSAGLNGATTGGTFFYVNNSTAAFSKAGTIKLIIKDCGFVAAGAGIGVAYAVKQTNLADYFARCEFYGCNIWLNMGGGFYGNFILTTWRRCEFGYYGTVAAQFLPIRSFGDIAGNQTNANLIDDCYIRNSKGNETIHFNAGSDLAITNTRFEGNNATKIINAAGIMKLSIMNCYFEDCTNATYPITLGNDSTGVQGTVSTNLLGNFTTYVAGNTGWVSVSGAVARVNLINNVFTQIAGKVTISNINALELVSGNNGTPDLTNGFYNGVGKLGMTGPLDLSNAAAGQINFPAIQNPSADPNTLDNYSEFDWTPIAVGFTGTGTAVLTGKGTYIGRVRFLGIRIDPNGTGTIGFTAGTSYIGGHPINATLSAGVLTSNVSTAAAGGVGNIQGAYIYPSTMAAAANIYAVDCTYI